MNSNWKEYNLGQIVDLLTKKVNGSTINLTNYISTENMLPEKGGITISSGLPKQDNFLEFKIGDVLFSNIRTYFKKVWQATFDGGVSNDVIVFRTRDNKILDQSFLYYLIASDSFISHTVRTAKGTKMPRGDKEAIKKFKFYIPEDIEEQKSIAKTLNSLDDKIANNNRVNQTLEEIAQTLFKSWFVDFEPVKAKIQAKVEGTNPQLAAMMAISGKTEEEIRQLPEQNQKELAITAALFPDDFEKSEWGLIPEGWSMESLGNVFRIKHGYAFKGEFISTEESDRILLTPGNFEIGGGFKSDKFKYFQSEDFPSDYILNTGNLVVTMTDLSKAGDTLGFPAFVPKYANKIFLHNQRIGKIIDNQLKESFLFQLMCQKNYREKILGSATGSTVKHTSPSRIYEFEFVRPSTVLIERFDNIVGRQIDHQIALEEETKLLGIIRDTLLPKLLSGKIIRKQT